MRASTDTTERLEIVVSCERLAAIEDQWTRLWHDCDAFIFQSHDWISTWWATMNDPQHARLRIGLVWNGDKLCAVLPLAITRRKGLRFLEWAAVAYSDYGDLLRAPGCTDEALDRLWGMICDAGGFDLALINRLLPDAAAARLFVPGKLTHGVRLRPSRRQEVSFRTQGDWKSGAEWLASHTKNTRRNYTRKLKKLENTGTLRFRLLGDDEPLGPVLDRLSDLKRQWLERTARTSSLFDDGASILAPLVDVLARAGILRLFVIELDGVAIAIAVNFVQRGTMMAWVLTYDADHARLSPGMILIFSYVQWSIDHGLGTVDQLCGNDAFKNRFATHVVTLRSVTGARTMKGRLSLFAHGLCSRFRRKRDRTDPVAVKGG